MAAGSPSVGATATARSDYKLVFNQLSHMAALSRTGMVEHVAQGLVDRALVLGSSSNLSSAEDIQAWINETFRVTVTLGDIQRRVESGVQQHRIVRRDGQYQLRSDALAEVKDAIESESKLEARVRSEWLAASEADGLLPPTATPEQAWECLRHYMARVFQQHGYQSVQLLDPTAATSRDDLVTLDSCVDEALTDAGIPDGEDADRFRRAINQFFMEATTERTRYIMQLLDATFTFFTLSSPGDASAYLRQTQRPLTVFVDTNVVFELLELHVTPDEAVSKELIEFIDDNGLPVHLRVHQRTWKEIQSTVRGIGSRLRSRQWPQSVSSAALRTGCASGVELKYHQLNAEQPVSAAVFMEKYENHMAELLGDFGIEVYRPTPDEYEEQEKHLLVAEYQAFLAEERPNVDKPYETAEHDLAVWLTIRDMRTGGKSTLDSGAVFLSNDRVFLGFDQRVLRGVDPVTVVLPRALLQVLRPFGDDNADYNRRFVQAFAAPGFRTAHSDYDEATSELLSLLATYKDVPEEAAFRILSDEMVRASIKGGADPADLIESEVTRINVELMEEREAQAQAQKELAQELTHERRRVAEAESEVRNRDEKIIDLTERSQAQVAAREREVAEKQDLARSLAEATDRINALEERERTQDEKRSKRRRLLTRIAIGVGIGACLLALGWFGSRALDWPAEGHPNRVGLLFVWVTGAVVAGWAAGTGTRDAWRQAGFALVGLATIAALL